MKSNVVILLEETNISSLAIATILSQFYNNKSRGSGRVNR